MNYFFQLGIRILTMLTPLLLIIFLLSYNVSADINENIVISGYGFIVFFYFITMLVLSRFNKKQIERLMNNKIYHTYFDNSEKTTSCVVCGYQENEIYFKECLKSLKQIDFNKILVIIDGNSENDNYMVEI